jgi:fumarylacetoacetase
MSWININAESDFSIANFPMGIAQYQGKTFAASRLGDHIVNLKVLFDKGYLSHCGIDTNVFDSHVLNDFIQCGKKNCTSVREKLIELFSDESSDLAKNKADQEEILIAASEVNMLLPLDIGDYTDFYSSIEHATNVGKMFRDPANALLPNWKHLPVGYHGRSSSIIVSGEPIHRPKGQTKPKDDEPPVFGPCRLLDFELEMSFITYPGKPLGQSISTDEADQYIFGMCLFNDWSARDIQKWEYVPLGPFLAKNFASSLAPWIVMIEALEPFRVKGPVQDPKVLPYLQYSGDKNIDINLEVYLQPEGSVESRICRSNYKYMYWNMNQQLAHQTVNGCNINAGDMYASGTISGPTEDSFGSMLELSWSGTKTIKLKDGAERKFIQDGDTVIMRGYCEKNGKRVGFGEVSSQVLGAAE